MPPEVMDDVISLNQTAIALDYEAKYKLDASFRREGYSLSDFVWESENEDIASVSANGLVTGNRVGTTIITVKTKDGAFSSTCEVVVNATNFLYQEPLLDFGEGKSFVLANETRELLYNRSNFLLFEGENDSVTNVIYNFANSTYKESVVLLKNNEEIADQAFLFLEQRYEYKGHIEGMHVFTNDDIMAGISDDTENGLSVMYLKNGSDMDAKVDVFQHLHRMENVGI